MHALLYRPNNRWQFATALTAAAAIHLAAISLATTQREAPVAPGIPAGPPEISLDPADPVPDPPIDDAEPLPTPPTFNDFHVEDTATPPVRRRPREFKPLVKARNNTTASSPKQPGARALALNAPRPEYPYEARRRKITGDGVAMMTVDPGTGNVINVTLVKSTGNAFLDNAALAGFRRWRFKPGTVSSVTCPVTFTLNGASF